MTTLSKDPSKCFYVTICPDISYAKYGSYGINWKLSLIPVIRNWKSVCYGNGMFVAVAQSSNIAAYITEEDLAAGKPWSQSGYLINSNSQIWFSVCYGNGMFVAVASGSIATYITEEDLAAGNSWTQSSLPDSRSCRHDAASQTARHLM